MSWGLCGCPIRTFPTYLSGPIVSTRLYRPSAARAPRPASVIRTFDTSIILPSARTFSCVRIASPLLTKSMILLTPKPCTLTALGTEARRHHRRVPWQVDRFASG